MSNVFTRYMDENNTLLSSYYDHHKLAPRTIKTQQNARGSISSNPTTQELSRNSWRFHKISSLNVQENLKSKSTKYSKKSMNKKNNEKEKPNFTIGRQLFQKQIQNSNSMGPGDYNPTLTRSRSFGYIKKQEQAKNLPSKKIRQSLNQYLGPGRYFVQNSENNLSNHKSLQGMRFNSEKLIRCILSKQKTQKMNLRINEQNEKRQIWQKKLGPGSYNVQKSLPKTANFTKTISFPVSMTQRSSLIKNDKLPGPGEYNWGTFIGDKFNQQSKKPKIQFKFVH